MRNRDKELTRYAEYVKKMIEDETTAPITIFFVKHEEKRVKRIFSNVLGADVDQVTFEERSLSEFEKRQRFLKIVLRLALVYIVTTFLIIVYGAIFGMSEKIMDLFAYFGNIVGFGCSIYVIRSGFKFKHLLFFIIGIFGLIFNAIALFDFFTEYLF